MRTHLQAKVWLPVLALFVAAASVHADDWPQWLGPQRDGVWRETGILDKFPQGADRALAHAGRRRLRRSRGGRRPRLCHRSRFAARDQGSRQSLSPTNSDGEERLWCLDETNGNILWK